MNSPRISDYHLDVILKLHYARLPDFQKYFGSSTFEEMTLAALQELQERRAADKATGDT